MSERVLTIQRSKWRRGGDSDDLVKASGMTYLLNHRGLMCCLGFDALAHGFKESQIEGRTDPAEMSDRGMLDDCEEYRRTRVIQRREHDSEDDHEYNVHELTPAAKAAVDHNDATNISEEERERLVAEDLKSLGWDRVEFVD